ncbi:hypothetical protein [Frateuria terrea]|uniref:RiboL-PSP-HEPN domain-containing protein n=1 Tax=Frateuria terrea TaxID=529704 RepID=A0A1H6SIZ0_9GAMM|nr:hypothetical protein [Frateuria terrea]SEI67823.1 hypothetical protein SAMN04487997_1433 [Frateuria terrea]SFP26804.1 hypothetical protein SAMN02927913_1348 [Frateuria terrea]
MDTKAVVRRLGRGAERGFDFNEESRAFNLLAHFQLVELSLKVYIGTAHRLIAARVDGLMPYNFDERSLERAPLERLLSMFKVVNSNGPLQKRLAGLVDKRNDVAHQMLLPHFGVPRRHADIRRCHDELKAVQESLDRAMKFLAREIVSLKEAPGRASGP